jgi:hypothetical protein
MMAVLGSACGEHEEREFRFLNFPILNGDPDYSQEHMAVVALTFGGGACSGTLISNEVVLTAGHCVSGYGPGSFTVRFGYELNSPDYTRNVSETWVHPNYDSQNIARDIAMLRLSSNAPASITPIPYLPSSMGITDADIGGQIEYVGFGQTETGSSGRKLHMTTDLNWVCTSPGGCNIPNGWASQDTICIDQEPSGICFGDSGGPAFIVRNSIEYVAGVSSYVGDDRCRYLGCSTKVDEYEDEIKDFVGGILGVSCTAAAECLSGYCVDGVCCESACGANCQACNLQTTLGLCRTVPDGTHCADGNLCNGDETCQAGQCVPGSPPVCDDFNICTLDSCDAVVGCQYANVQDGTSCTNGDICDGEETCLGGNCSSGMPLDCDDHNMCTQDTCDPLSGCQHITLADGVGCGGGPCGAATCRNGVCELSNPDICENGDPCTDNTCDPVIGCLRNPTPDGTACPDQNPCNGEETCLQGICRPGTMLDCDDFNLCTADTCDINLGCQHQPVADGSICGGGLCAEAHCQAGECVAADPDECTDDDPCTQDWCHPQDGCRNDPLPDGSECGYCMVCSEMQCVEVPDCAVRRSK